MRVLPRYGTGSSSPMNSGRGLWAGATVTAHLVGVVDEILIGLGGVIFPEVLHLDAFGAGLEEREIWRLRFRTKGTCDRWQPAAAAAAGSKSGQRRPDVWRGGSITHDDLSMGWSRECAHAPIGPLNGIFTERHQPLPKGALAPAPRWRPQGRPQRPQRPLSRERKGPRGRGEPAPHSGWRGRRRHPSPASLPPRHTRSRRRKRGFRAMWSGARKQL